MLQQTVKICIGLSAHCLTNPKCATFPVARNEGNTGSKLAYGLASTSKVNQ